MEKASKPSSYPDFLNEHAKTSRTAQTDQAQAGNQTLQWELSTRMVWSVVELAELVKSWPKADLQPSNLLRCKL